MDRRGFIKTMLAAATAPAIVKADNIMRVWVPPEKKIITNEIYISPDNSLTDGAWVNIGDYNSEIEWFRSFKN
jgi:hypothetical protein